MSPVNKSKAVKGKKVRKTRQELDLEGRERKRQKKRRGHKPGARNNEHNAQGSKGGMRTERDPRIGSKKPVALLVEPSVAKSRVQAVVQPEVKTVLTPEEELARLENDPRLDALLERLEEGATLNSEEQRYVDEMLDRIDALMEELGIELEDDEEEEESEDIMQLLRRGSPKDAI
ncbi:GTPase-activating protein [Edwardsiella hoshinae]|uniref:Der GTPase-activating protein YihI n=1 Tax=Edwardsiella hoshinae TaxID=93378 RepID=A0A376DN69_9GAMM|nr:Der GTPase-activating protein YihI [Edwardsiella hoshinae]AOV98422.1 GTPase-activating protein [Edwardsiella hoshinae]QPR28725.1 Der GTPase-activating protein YihI [Edwardsiella hoshinae]STC92351.1 Der GTPase-activating protein YihI [Edwardsiella hoshinae]